MSPFRVHYRVVVSGVPTAAFGAFQPGPCHALAHRDHVAYVQREVPAGIELAVPLHDDVIGAPTQLCELFEGELHFVCSADDPD